MAKRKFSPDSGVGSSRHNPDSPYLRRPHRRRRTNPQSVYQVGGSRTLPPIPGIREFGREATRRYNEGLAEEIMGGIAGAAIGGALFNVPGAIVGGILGARRKEVPQNKNMGGIKEAKQLLVQRSSNVVKGKTKVKRVKKVHLSKKFIKGVKQVMAGSQATGSFITIKQGMVGSLVGAGNGGNLTSTIFGTAGAVGILYPGAAISSGSRTLFNTLSNWSTSVNSSCVANTDLNFFTPAKILDAASVLFNGKALGDPYSATGNLSTVFVGTTTAPVTNIPGQLKINVLSSSVDFELKNVSDRVVTMEIWECTPTLKFQSTNPLALVQQIATTYQNITNNNNTLYVRDQPGGASNELFYEQAIDPLTVMKKYNGLPMTWKKRNMILAPDETCIHSIIGPSGVLDFSKLNVAGLTLPQINVMLKNWSVGCIISIVGDQAIQPTLSVNRGDKAAYSDNVNVRMGMPVSMQVREYYRIAVPEIAGFTTQTPAVGTVSNQLLNYRKPKCVIWNQCVANGITSTAPVSVSNEQQPMTNVTGGQLN